MESQEQINNSKPWLFKKGQSGNPGGRPKGSISLKEYARRYLSELDEEGKKEFMDGLPKDIIWKMAEGNPKQDTDITSAGRPIIQLPPEVIAKNEINTNSENNVL